MFPAERRGYPRSSLAASEPRRFALQQPMLFAWLSKPDASALMRGDVATTRGNDDESDAILTQIEISGYEPWILPTEA